MNATINNLDESMKIHIELTPKANEQYNLAKNTLKDNNKLALRISACSRG